MTRKNLMAYAIACFTMTVTSSCKADRTTSSQQMGPDSTATVQQTKESHLSLLFAGDLMQHGPQINAAHRSDGSYNYDECFTAIKQEVERADVAIANFEVTLGGPPYAGYPQFRAPDEYLKACVDAGFDIMMTANNHCLDSRRKGLERTILMMDSLKVPHLGTYVNSEARQEQYPFLLEKNGMRIVLLNFTYGTNGLVVEKPNVVNMMDTTEIRADIAKAKTMNPDVIIALPHWGIEYQLLPSAEQRRVAKWLIDNGVDHVIGGHPHVAQPLELSEDGNHLVAWSMGNLISNMKNDNTYGGYMVRMEFTKKGDKARLSDCGYSLYWVSKPVDSGGKHNYRVLPIDMPDDGLNAIEKSRRNTIRTAMRKLMEKHTKGIKEYTF